MTPRDPRVSACLIVRDEAGHIDACLESLAGFADEIVVVDTGSGDDTVERARRHGARIHHFPWNGDFSAARNEAVARARGAWVLTIDADERLAIPAGFDRAALLASPHLAYRLWIRPHRKVTPLAVLRLWRRNAGIAYRGRFHESVTADVARLAAETGRPVAVCDLAIDHLGYEGTAAEKGERNLPLLEAELEANPQRAFCWWHLGQIHARRGDAASAEAAWRKGLAAIRAAAPGTPHPADSRIHETLAAALAARGEDAMALIEEGLALFPGQLMLQQLRAAEFVRRGSPEQAVETLQRLSAIDPETFADPDISYPKSLFSRSAPEALAWCLLRLGRLAEAAAIARELVSRYPENPAYAAMAAAADPAGS